MAYIYKKEDDTQIVFFTKRPCGHLHKEAILTKMHQRYLLSFWGECQNVSFNATCLTEALAIAKAVIKLKKNHHMTVIQ